MDLWIRNQERERFEKLNYAQINAATINGEDEYYVYINGFNFGTYKTKERALQVLDEIQHFFQNKHIIKFNRSIKDVKQLQQIEKVFNDEFVILDESADITPINSMVYEMPKK